MFTDISRKRIAHSFLVFGLAGHFVEFATCSRVDRESEMVPLAPTDLTTDLLDDGTQEPSELAAAPGSDVGADLKKSRKTSTISAQFLRSVGLAAEQAKSGVCGLCQINGQIGEVVGPARNKLLSLVEEDPRRQVFEDELLARLPIRQGIFCGCHQKDFDALRSLVTMDLLRRRKDVIPLIVGCIKFGFMNKLTIRSILGVTEQRYTPGVRSLLADGLFHLLAWSNIKNILLTVDDGIRFKIVTLFPCRKYRYEFGGCVSMLHKYLPSGFNYNFSFWDAVFVLHACAECPAALKLFWYNKTGEVDFFVDCTLGAIKKVMNVLNVKVGKTSNSDAGQTEADGEKLEIILQSLDWLASGGEIDNRSGAAQPQPTSADSSSTRALPSAEPAKSVRFFTVADDYEPRPGARAVDSRELREHRSPCWG
jgi:hypothetical protein